MSRGGCAKAHVLPIRGLDFLVIQNRTRTKPKRVVRGYVMCLSIRVDTFPGITLLDLHRVISLLTPLHFTILTCAINTGNKQKTTYSIQLCRTSSHTYSCKPKSVLSFNSKLSLFVLHWLFWYNVRLLSNKLLSHHLDTSSLALCLIGNIRYPGWMCAQM